MCSTIQTSGATGYAEYGVFSNHRVLPSVRRNRCFGLFSFCERIYTFFKVAKLFIEVTGIYLNLNFNPVDSWHKYTKQIPIREALSVIQIHRIVKHSLVYTP
jgi:hypothetical protein